MAGFAAIAQIGMIPEARTPLAAYVRNAAAAAGSIAKRVNASKILGGRTMKHYRIRKGSIADHARAFLVGAVFWAVLLSVAVSAYPA